jgi:hypothetical protein
LSIGVACVWIPVKRSACNLPDGMRARHGV